MGLLEGQRAVVTGGGSGIGRATCRRMAEEGARVAVFDVDGDSAAATAKEIGGSSYAVDVGDAEAMQTAVDAAAAELGACRSSTTTPARPPSTSCTSSIWPNGIGSCGST